MQAVDSPREQNGSPVQGVAIAFGGAMIKSRASTPTKCTRKFPPRHPREHVGPAGIAVEALVHGPPTHLGHDA
jgi:hypothetical protein